MLFYLIELLEGFLSTSYSYQILIMDSLTTFGTTTAFLCSSALLQVVHGLGPQLTTHVQVNLFITSLDRRPG